MVLDGTFVIPCGFAGPGSWTRPHSEGVLANNGDEQAQADEEAVGPHQEARHPPQQSPLAEPAEQEAAKSNDRVRAQDVAKPEQERMGQSDEEKERLPPDVIPGERT